MNRKAATKFVHDWLWESDERLTTEQSWLRSYVGDVASMIMEATIKQEAELNFLRSLVREMGKSVKWLAGMYDMDLRESDIAAAGRARSLLFRLRGQGDKGGEGK